MRWSRLLKGGLIVAVIGAFVAIPAVSAFADIKATFDVHPNEAAAKSSHTFHLSWLNSDGATSGTTQADNPQCIVFTLGDGTTNFSGLAPGNGGAVNIGGALSGWSGVTGVDGSGNPTYTVSGADALYKGVTLDAWVTATAPDANGSTSTWSAVGYPDSGCATPRANKVNTVGVDITAACTGPGCGGTPGHFQPDALIRLAKRHTHFIGGGIINGTGHKQHVTNHVLNNHSIAAFVKVVNVGNKVDDIVVGGTGGQAGFKVAYWFGKKNISGAVRGHGYTFHLKPGAHRIVKVIVTALPRAKKGKERTWQILARSTGNPFKRDCTKFTAIIA